MLKWDRRHQCKERPIRQIPFRAASYKKSPNFLSWILAVIILLAIVVLAHADIVTETIAKESSNQPYLAQVAVAEVIKTRAKERKQSCSQVIFSKKQFSCNNPGVRQKARTKKELTTALKAWNEAKATGVNLYHDGSVNPKWTRSKNVKFVKRIGDLYFYKEAINACVKF